MRIDNPTGQLAALTGSFSGSFTGVGNFTGLIADSVEYANVTNKPAGLVSGSASQARTQIGTVIGTDVQAFHSNLEDISNLNPTDSTFIVGAGSSFVAEDGATARTSLGLGSLAVLNTDSALNSIDLSNNSSVSFANLTNKPTLISQSAQITITESQISDLSHYSDSDADARIAAASVTDLTDVTDAGSGIIISSAERTKLTGIETSADVTDTENVTAAGALMDSEVTNLADVKAFDPADYATAAQGNTADSAQQPPAEGAFVDGDKTKLDGIEANADVTDTANVTAAGALMDSEVDADIKTLSLPANTTISTFGKSLVDDANATAARSTLGVDAAGTDNSIDVTLVTTSHNYLSLTGQAITLGQIDISDDTNLAVSDTTGQTGINLTLSGDSLSGVVSGLTTTSNVTFASLTTTGNTTIEGNLVVEGTTQTVNTETLSVEDNMIYLNSGSNVTNPDLGFAGNYNDGTYAHAGLFSDASDSHTFKFYKGYTPEPDAASHIDTTHASFTLADLEAAGITANGNITVTGTVDGRDVAADGSKLDGIAASANNYTHPTHPGDDFSVDTGALTGATVVSDIDINVTTDALGHVTDANGSVATRTLTLADLGYTGTTDANTYVHPTHAGDDISIDTGALTGATVISDLDFNVTTDGLGHVTDANGTVATRTLTLADLGYTGATNANNYSLPEATSTVRGGIELFSNTDQSVAANAVTTTAGRTYGIQLNSDGQAVVNVPWVDTNTTYTVGDGGLTQKNFTTTLKNKLDGIAASANNYTHPTFNGDDFSVDTGALTGATVISDLDINVTTDANGHVTDANGTVATRTLTLADLGYTGATNATANTGTVDTSGTPVDNDFAKFTDANTIEGRSASETRSDLGLGSLATLSTVNAATITDNSVGAAELNVTGNGTTSQFLRSDGDGTFTWATPTDTNTQLSTEAVQDIVGAMFTGNTETRISATYQDGDGTIDLVVTDQSYTLPEATATSRGGIELFSNTDQSVAANAVTATAGRTYGIQLNSAGQAVVNVPWSDTNTDTNTFRTVTAGGNTLGASETLAFTAGTNVTITESGGAVTISATDTNTQATRDSLGIDTNDNVAFEGLMVGQTTGATANTIRCTGDIVAYYSSDKQFKDNIKPLEGALDKVKQIRGVEFDWNDKQDVYEGHDIGVVAQEVEAVYPDLVHYREHSDSKAVDYVKLNAVLIEAIKELAAKVDELSK